jgi:diaminopimelate epimerase
MQEGLVGSGGPIVVGTRDGDKTITREQDGELSVDMGVGEVRGTSKIAVADRAWEAQDIRTGNPHAVTFVDDLADAGSLLEAPEHDAATYPDGVNVEFVVRKGDRHVAMRVHERGSGETRSCGTGACAVAFAAALADGAERPVTYRVDVPGGTLHVTWTGEDHLVLTGPAEIVARGEMDWTA